MLNHVNRSIAVVFVILFTFAGHAKTVKIEMHTKNKMGFKTFDQLRLSDKEVLLNGVPIDKNLYPLLPSHVGRLTGKSNFGRVNNCYSGTYRLLVKTKVIIKDETGCLEGNRASEINQAIQAIHKLTIKI